MLATRPGSTTEGAAQSAQGPRRVVHRQLSREGGRALEILGHAIEYLADEYAQEIATTGHLGWANPRIEAIQVLKALNRTVYFEGTEMLPVFSRMRRWLAGARVNQAAG